MLIYRTKRSSNKNYSQKLLGYTIGLIIITVILVVFKLIPTDFMTSSSVYPIVPFNFPFLFLISFFFKKKVDEVIIDREAQKVFVKYFQPIKGNVQKEYLFNCIRIELKKRKWYSVLEVNLLEGNKVLINLDEFKDGFSFETLNSLATELEKLTSPLSR